MVQPTSREHLTFSHPCKNVGSRSMSNDGKDELHVYLARNKRLQPLAQLRNHIGKHPYRNACKDCLLQRYKRDLSYSKLYSSTMHNTFFGGHREMGK